MIVTGQYNSRAEISNARGYICISHLIWYYSAWCSVPIMISIIKIAAYKEASERRFPCGKVEGITSTV